jgi:hypothetical protein
MAPRCAYLGGPDTQARLSNCQPGSCTLDTILPIGGCKRLDIKVLQSAQPCNAHVPIVTGFMWAKQHPLSWVALLGGCFLNREWARAGLHAGRHPIVAIRAFYHAPTLRDANRHAVSHFPTRIHRDAAMHALQQLTSQGQRETPTLDRHWSRADDPAHACTRRREGGVRCCTHLPGPRRPPRSRFVPATE